MKCQRVMLVHEPHRAGSSRCKGTKRSRSNGPAPLFHATGIESTREGSVRTFETSRGNQS